ncbi:MAG: aminotransferase class IV [Gammaproteobacteria bacterium]|nr:aminotransferase class IV [Gammaproteobacteria bacterium]
MTKTVYLNGEFLPINEAKISVLDRGFLFGEGVYEAIPVYNGKLFRTTEHLNRLHKSLEGIAMSVKFDEAHWTPIFEQLIEKNGGGNQALYLQVTRGTMESRNHSWDIDIQPNIFLMSLASKYPDPDAQELGVKAITLDDIRWKFCNLKTTSLLANTLLHQQATDKDAVEAILIRDGNAIEGSASNIFIVKDEMLITPPEGNHMLSGITREVILELCQKYKILYRVTHITEDELHSADEVWICASTKEIVPITTLNQHAVGKGVPGPLWHTVIKHFKEYRQSLMQG